MDINFTVSPSSITEDFTAKAYEVDLNGNMSEVDSLAIPAPHLTADEYTFTGLDRVVHRILVTGDDTSVVYANYIKSPEVDTVTSFDYIRFKIGDGGANTPLVNATAYVNLDMAGLTADDYQAFRGGYGPVFETVHIINNPAGGFAFANPGDKFGTAEEWLITRKPERVTTVVNDSVVGKLWGPTAGNSNMYVNVTATLDYTTTHLRKLIRLAGVNAIYRFTSSEVPPVGYIFRISNNGAYGALTPYPKVQFINAPLLYGNTTLTEVGIPLGQTFECVWDGTNWNSTFSLPFTATVPQIYKGSVAVGDVSVDKSVAVTFPNVGTSDWRIAGSFVSNGNINADNDLCWCIKNKSNTGFTLGVQEVGGAVQDVVFEYAILY